MPHICMDEVNMFIAAIRELPAMIMFLRFKAGI
jgi:hypothetical protein